jgi:hypothetical protein
LSQVTQSRKFNQTEQGINYPCIKGTGFTCYKQENSFLYIGTIIEEKIPYTHKKNTVPGEFGQNKSRNLVKIFYSVAAAAAENVEFQLLCCKNG